MKWKARHFYKIYIYVPCIYIMWAYFSIHLEPSPSPIAGLYVKSDLGSGPPWEDEGQQRKQKEGLYIYIYIYKLTIDALVQSRSLHARQSGVHVCDEYLGDVLI